MACSLTDCKCVLRGKSIEDRKKCRYYVARISEEEDSEGDITRPKRKRLTIKKARKPSEEAMAKQREISRIAKKFKKKYGK